MMQLGIPYHLVRGTALLRTQHPRYQALRGALLLGSGAARTIDRWLLRATAAT